MQLNNLEVWQLKETLYFKYSDGHLLKISGENVSKIKYLIEFLKEEKEEKDIQELTSEKISPEEIKELLTFLIKNGIVIPDKKTENKIHKIAFYGNVEALEYIKENIKFKNEIIWNNISDLNSIENVDLILFIAPVFDDIKFIEELSNYSYKKQIPLFYNELLPLAVNIGPFVMPQMHSPSLLCYTKRKMSNVKNLQLYSEFIFSLDKTKLNNVKLTNYPFYRISIELIIKELEQYIEYDGLLSNHLIAKSVIIDFLAYNIEKSRVLKDPSSELFHSTPFTPFNG